MSAGVMTEAPETGSDNEGGRDAEAVPVAVDGGFEQRVVCRVAADLAEAPYLQVPGVSPARRSNASIVPNVGTRTKLNVTHADERPRCGDHAGADPRAATVSRRRVVRGELVGVSELVER